MRKLVILTALVCAAISACSAPYFSGLNKVSSSEKYNTAFKIYDSAIAVMDSAHGTTALNQLLQLAVTEDDERLKAAYYALMAEFHKRLYCPEKAITFSKQALELAGKKNMKNIEADMYSCLGWVYYEIKQDYPLAFENMLKANNLIRTEIGFDHYLQASKFLFVLARMYFDFGNLDDARSLLLEALKYPARKAGNELQVYNTLGLVCRAQKKIDSAIYYFRKAIEVGKTCHDSVWTAIAGGNLGAMYYIQHRYDEAIPWILQDYNTSRQSAQWVSAALAMLSLADINFIKNHYAECGQQLAEALQLYQMQPDMGVLGVYYSIKYKLKNAQSSYKEAIICLDSAKIVKAEMEKRNNAIIVSRAEQKVQLEKHLAEIKLLESKTTQKILIRNFVIVSVILLLLIAVQFGYRLQKKRKQDLDNLNSARQQLTHYLESLKEKNELIEQFQEEIEHLNTLPNYVLEKEKEKEELTDKLKRYTILTEDHWNEFRHLFDKVHKNFFVKLKMAYPNLTQAEIRLLALLKLDLSRTEIAGLLGISAETVRKTRQRVENKINLKEDQYLEDIVFKM